MYNQQQGKTLGNRIPPVSLLIFNLRDANVQLDFWWQINPNCNPSPRPSCSYCWIHCVLILSVVMTAQSNNWTARLAWLSVAPRSNSTVIDFPYKSEELALQPGSSWGWLWCMSVLKMSWNCRRSETNLPRTLCSNTLVSLCVRDITVAHEVQTA